MAGPVTEHFPDSQRLQELWDREQIRELVARYCRAIDRIMVQDAKAVYFDDATEDHGVYRGPGQGFVEALSGILSDEYIGHHCLGQTLIELHGDAADCETYFICGMAWNQPGDPPSFADVRGRYIDSVQCRRGEWRIASRVAVLDLTVQRPFDPEWDIAAAFVRGQRYPGDLVYRTTDLRARVPESDSSAPDVALRGSGSP